MEAHSKKQKIKAWILTFWDIIPKTFKSEEIVKAIWITNESEYLYPDTILRYMRELKSEGKINYRVQCRKSRIYLKI
jgi:hypothetical protein